MSKSPSKKGAGKLFGELRRRHVIETAVIYVAGAWALIEVAATLLPVFGMPEVAVKILVIVTLVAFPFVIGLSWTFDISLKGLVRTDEQPAAAADFDFNDVAERSIAVLPFINMTGDSDNDYFGDGLSEELLNLLSRRPRLKVAARTSSFAFRGRNTDIREIGGLLGVRHVLEGSVRQAGKRIRISAQLIEAPTGYHLWSETFDRSFDDIFALQDEIALAITDALQMALEEKSQHERRGGELPTDNIDAYQHYLRANYLYQRRGATALEGAIAALENAIELDPGYSQAYALLAAARAILHEYKKESREDAFVRAEAHARQAIVLNPALGEPHAVLGYIALRLWRWDAAEQHLTRALETDESLPVPHQWYSNLLNDVGRHEDANREAQRAHAIDPLSPMANNVLAFTALFRSDDETAQKHAAIARKYGLGGGIPDYVDFILALRRRDHDAAMSGWSAHLQSCGLAADWLEPVVAAIIDREQLPLAASSIESALADDRIDSANAFFHFVLLADPRAYAVAETLLDDHKLAHTWLMLPEAASLREGAGFRTLMEEMGVMDYWRRNGFPPQIQAA